MAAGQRRSRLGRLAAPSPATVLLLRALCRITLMLVIAGQVFGSPLAHAGSGKGFLAVISEPEGVTVLIRGKVMGQTPGQWEVPPGTYEVTAKKEHYEPSTKTVVVREDEIEKVNFTLLPRSQFKVERPEQAAVKRGQGKLMVVTEPMGASVSLDGVSVDEPTPLTLTEVAAGEHEVVIRYRDVVVNKRVVIEDGKSLLIKESLVRGSLEVRTTPPGAEVVLRGNGEELRKRSPALFAGLALGDWGLAIHQTFFAPFTQELQVGTQALVVELVLEETEVHRSAREGEMRAFLEAKEELGRLQPVAERRVADARAQKQPILSPDPTWSKQNLLTELPGKQMKSETPTDYTKHTGGQMVQEAACCLISAPVVLVAGICGGREGGKVAGGIVGATSTKPVHDPAAYRAALAYNRELRAELARQNAEIESRNAEVDRLLRDLEGHNQSVAEANRSADRIIAAEEKRLEEIQHQMRQHRDAVIHNAQEVGLSFGLAQQASNEKWAALFRNALEKGH